LKPLSELRIPQFIGFMDTNTKAKLLVFCDASMKLCATAVYLHIERQNSVEVNLVFSKMRLASSGTGKKKSRKEITFPRLELLAVTLRVQVANFVAKELKVTLII